MHEGTKLIAAIGIALEHVEGRSPGREEDDFARLRDRVRALDRIGQRIRDLASAQRLSNPAQMRSAISPMRMTARTFSPNERREAIRR